VPLTTGNAGSRSKSTVIRAADRQQDQRRCGCQSPCRSSGPQGRNACVCEAISKDSGSIHRLNYGGGSRLRRCVALGGGLPGSAAPAHMLPVISPAYARERSTSRKRRPCGPMKGAMHICSDCECLVRLCEETPPAPGLAVQCWLCSPIRGWSILSPAVLRAGAHHAAAFLP